MAVVTPLYCETNLVGNLTAQINASDTTIRAAFKDKITGAARTPQSTTLLFVIDKGSETFPNPSYEIILAGSHSTSSGVTTLSSCVRGLVSYGTSVAAGTGTSHLANAEIGSVDLHLLWNIMVACLRGDASPAGFMLGTRLAYELAGISGARIFADATARDAAITAPANGDACYLTSAGLCYDYIAGSWVARASGGTFPNGSTTVAGKFEEATLAEAQAGTATGGTGADLALVAGTHGLYLNPTGAIIMYGGAAAPTGWLMCDGSAVSRATYAGLFSAIGTAFGVGDGSTTFNLPDMRGRAPYGKAAAGTYNALGNNGGAETANIAHTHTLTAAYAKIGKNSNDDWVASKNATTFTYSQAETTTVADQSGTSSNSTDLGGSTDSGGSGSLDIKNPYEVVNFIIKT